MYRTQGSKCGEEATVNSSSFLYIPYAPYTMFSFPTWITCSANIRLQIKRTYIYIYIYIRAPRNIIWTWWHVTDPVTIPLSRPPGHTRPPTTPRGVAAGSRSPGLIGLTSAQRMDQWIDAKWWNFAGIHGLLPLNWWISFKVSPQSIPWINGFFCLLLIKGSWEAILPCYGQIEFWDLKWWRVVRDWDLTLMKGGVRRYTT